MGCSGSVLDSGTPAQAFLGSIKAVPWGVLGEAMDVAAGTPWATKKEAPAPDANILIVDPASINVASDPNFRPAEAGGAAGAVYRFLGIDSNSTFPPDVVSGLNGTADAVYKRYGYPHALHVIHVIGPDFKALPGITDDEAIASLATCYAAVLTRFAKDHPSDLLRLVPVSAGIYAGGFRERMAELTAAALHTAAERIATEEPALFQELPPNQGRNCELCLFDPREAAPYAAALKAKFSEEASPATV